MATDKSQTNDRYHGKPITRLLECYVLSLIGALSEDDRKTLISMQPKLEKIYHYTGSWEQIIEHVMELPPNMHQLILSNWLKNQDIAKKNMIFLGPQNFAEMFVDSNFKA